MFKEDQPIIGRWAQQSPENMAKVIQFCIISARERFYNVPALISEAQENAPGVLFGWKYRAYYEIWERRDEIFRQLHDINDLGGRRKEKANYMLAFLCDIHGLAATKAGFALQLVFGVSGCLDTVNRERLGVNPDTEFRIGRLRTRKGRLNAAMRYNTLVERLGGTETLWNEWCIAMVARYPKVFYSADQVSYFHLTCLGLDQSDVS